MILHDVFSVDEAHNKALEIERLQCRTPFFKHLTPTEETTTETSAAALMTTTTTSVAKGKENPYAKPDAGKY